MSVLVYEKPTCSTCRKLAELLAERGIDFETVEYHVTGLTAKEIRELLTMAGIPAADALRMRETGARELKTASEDEIVAAIVKRPELLQRPFVVADGRARACPPGRTGPRSPALISS